MQAGRQAKGRCKHPYHPSAPPPPLRGFYITGGKSAKGRCKHPHHPRPYAALRSRGVHQYYKERLLWCSAAARGEPAEEAYEEVEHAENDEAGGDDIVAGPAAVCLGLGSGIGDRGDDDAYDSHERAAYH